MLIVTIGPGLSGAGILADLSDQDTVVAVLLPGHRLSQQVVKDLLQHSYVIEYLQPPKSITLILCEIFDKLKHVVTDSAKPLVFVNRPASTTDIMKLVNDTSGGGVDVIEGRGGTPEQISIDSKLLSNPLLPRFFTLASELGVGDQRSMELLQQTFGNLRA